jgi:DNA-binding NarL/FixJ family response regulator
MSRIKVLVVEDDAFTRSTLVAALEFEGFDALGAAEGAAAAVASFNRHDHDALLADLDLGVGPSGLELAWLLRKTKPTLGVVFLTSFEDPRLHRNAMDELPVGSRYLIKQDLADRAQISQALKYSVQQAEQLLRYPSRKPGKPDRLNLSAVQIATLKLVAAGHSNQEIARLRFVSEKAVEQTVQRLAQKLAVSSQTKNIRVALANAYARLTGGKG